MALVVAARAVCVKALSTSLVYDGLAEMGAYPPEPCAGVFPSGGRPCRLKRLRCRELRLERALTALIRTERSRFRL